METAKSVNDRLTLETELIELRFYNTECGVLATAILASLLFFLALMACRLGYDNVAIDHVDLSHAGNH